jgi:ABC-type multidrug transport system ATPase subunit
LSADNTFYPAWTARRHFKYVEQVRGIKSDALDLARRFELDINTKYRHLPSGNKQKLSLILALMHKPKLLILDEPTQGVDIGSKSAVYERVEQFAQLGGTVIVASSDTDELVRLCHRVLIMRSGVVACELFGDEITASRIVTETLGATSNRVGSRIAPRRISTQVIRDKSPASNSRENS